MTTTTKPATCPVPRWRYRIGLEFCQQRQRDAGLPLWDTLPPGMAGASEACPCAQSVPALEVGAVYWRFLEGGPTHDDAPGEFVFWFDKYAKRGVLTLPIPVGDDTMSHDEQDAAALAWAPTTEEESE